MVVVFNIPLQRDDLIGVPESPNDYRVRNNYNIRDLKTKLTECRQRVDQIGVDFLLDTGFDTVFSVLLNFHKEIPVDYKITSFQILEKAMKSLYTSLDDFINKDNVRSSVEKAEWQAKTKMLFYLFVQMIEMLEASESSSTDMLAVKGRGKKGASSTNLNDIASFWDVERKVNALKAIYAILQLNLAILFEPPVVEEDLVNLVANCQFRLLENPSIGLQRTKEVRVAALEVLGTLNQRCGYTLSCRLKIGQSLRHFEHLGVPLAEGVELFARQFGCTGLLMEVVRDISQIDESELSRDTSATRAYATFLTELASRAPDLMRPCLSLLIVHLDGDSASLRKCVLTVLGEFIISMLAIGNEVEDAQAEEAKNRETRDQLLDYLEDHVHDVHANVRSSVLQVWSRLATVHAIPLSRWHRLLALVIGRLHDKAATVRKQAVQLLTTLLQFNPFTETLPEEELKLQFEAENLQLQAMLKEAAVDKEAEAEWKAVETALKEAKSDEADEEMFEDEESQRNAIEHMQELVLNKDYPKAFALARASAEEILKDELFHEIRDETRGMRDKGEIAAQILRAMFFVCRKMQKGGDDLNSAEALEIAKKRVHVAYLRDSLAFAQELNKALPTVSLLLGSRQPSDILEAIGFFVSAFEFGVLNAMIGIRRMLSLVWSKEQTVRDAVVEAYKKLYINQNDSNARNNALHTVKNLIALVTGATIGELTSLEELIGLLVSSGDISRDCHQILWQYFTGIGVSGGLDEEDSRSALVLLGMIASAEPSVVASNLDVLIKHGLVERGPNDFKLAHDTCVAISKIIGAKPSTASETAALRFEPDHKIFESIRKLLVEGSGSKDSRFYIPMSQKAIAVIYKLSEHPDVTAGKIIAEIASGLEDGSVDSYVLRCLLMLVGHVALCQTNHLDVNVLNELKRRKHLREMKAASKASSRRKKSSVGSVRKGNNARRQSMHSSATPEDNDELDEVGGTEADDADFEYIRSVCEKEIVTGEDNAALLASFVPLIIQILSQPSKFNDPLLQRAASLTLAKFMLVSSELCEAQLQLIFTVLERSSDAESRANIIVACGDLAFRFPNTMEPWTPRMYSRLRDSSTLVRRNTLTVLTHLILNDMIKVKGQISDMALCVVDDDEKIAGLSRHFFAELSRKGNALYNVMPDIISRLSDVECGAEEQDFKTVMSYIVSLIDKDKHLESLVEKLCHRFRATSTQRQWRDLAYCLSLFSYSDKAVRKLQEHMSCFCDKLHEDAVYEAVTGVLVSARKNAKQETKDVIEEMEAKLEIARQKCLEDHKANVRAVAAKAPPPSSKRGRRRNKNEESEEEEEDEEMETESDEKVEPATGRRGRRHAQQADNAAPEQPKATPQPRGRRIAQLELTPDTPQTPTTPQPQSQDTPQATPESQAVGANSRIARATRLDSKLQDKCEVVITPMQSAVKNRLLRRARKAAESTEEEDTSSQDTSSQDEEVVVQPGRRGARQKQQVAESSSSSQEEATSKRGRAGKLLEVPAPASAGTARTSRRNQVSADESSAEDTPREKPSSSRRAGKKEEAAPARGRRRVESTDEDVAATPTPQHNRGRRKPDEEQRSRSARRGQKEQQASTRKNANRTTVEESDDDDEEEVQPKPTKKPEEARRRSARKPQNDEDEESSVEATPKKTPAARGRKKTVAESSVDEQSSAEDNSKQTPAARGRRAAAKASSTEEQSSAEDSAKKTPAARGRGRSKAAEATPTPDARRSRRSKVVSEDEEEVETEKENHKNKYNKERRGRVAAKR